MRLLLLHPPLLSATVWGRLVPALAAVGHVVAAPELLHTSADGEPDDVTTWWRTARDAAVAAMPDAEVVVAHSGAGVLAPVVLEALAAPRGVVLVDAALPAASGVHRTPARLRELVAGLAVDGRLPRWTTWWGDDALAEILPDAADRALLDASAPALPESFYDVEVPVPADWEPAGRGYLRLSDAYEADERLAAARGWRTVTLAGTHLSLFTDPEAVAAAVADLLPAAG